MNIYKNIVAGKNEGRTVLIDVFCAAGTQKSPVLVFFHGTKGFKDWGAWGLMHKSLNDAGIAFITANFSHNGIVSPLMTEISDPLVYGKNTISKELNDINQVINWVTDNAEEYNFDSAEITICGHSRAGGEVIVYGTRDNRISKIIALAPVSDFLEAYKDINISEWKKKGLIKIKNYRTGDEYPVNYSFYEDIQNNYIEFQIPDCAGKLQKPLLLIHAEDDQAVPFISSQVIYENCLHSLLITLEDGGHTFGTSHPWESDLPLPNPLQKVIENAIEFIVD